jgi:hypothetical protein
MAGPVCRRAFPAQQVHRADDRHDRHRGPGGRQAPDADQAALSGWGRTFRLCVIRVAERIPSVVPVTAWLILHR